VMPLLADKLTLPPLVVNFAKVVIVPAAVAAKFLLEAMVTDAFTVDAGRGL